MINYEKRLEIVEICKKFDIQGYVLRGYLGAIVVDVCGSVDLSYRELEELPLDFGEVSGDFDCSLNNLTTLKGSPNCVGGYFSCQKNVLLSLEYAPSEVGGTFDCQYNSLNSLEYGPKYVGLSYMCTSNHLTSFIGIPTAIKLNVICYENCFNIEAFYHLVDNGVDIDSVLRDNEFCKQSIMRGYTIDSILKS